MYKTDGRIFHTVRQEGSVVTQSLMNVLTCCIKTQVFTQCSKIDNYYKQNNTHSDKPVDKRKKISLFLQKVTSGGFYMYFFVLSQKDIAVNKQREDYKLLKH